MEATAAVLEEPVDSSDFAETRPASIESIEVADPGPLEVLVEIEAASLCGTDLKIARGHSEETYPLVMGHEGAGVVRAVGSGVTTVAPGDRVVLGRMACGRCESCGAGRSNLCDVRRTASANGTLREGGVRFSRAGTPVYHCHGVSSFSQYTVVDEEVAIGITADVPPERATLLGCGVFTGYGAVTNTAGVEAGAAVAVFGCGGVGLSAIQGAVAAGAEPIIAVDLVAAKLETAEALGATHVVDAAAGDPADRITALTDGGADYAVVCVGAVTAIEQAAQSVGKAGQVVVVGVPPTGESPALDIYDLMRAEKVIRGSFNGSYHLPEAIPHLADRVAVGELQLEPLVSSVRPLSELNETMADLESGSGIRHVIRLP